MCGIAVATDERRARTMISAIAHRGPDATAVKCHGSWWFAHARLSIIDVDERSNQPMTVGDTIIAYNGETWNWREIRRRSTRSWRTEGDTEVVAASFDTLGRGALNMFEGMMAVAWKTGDDLLHVARDRFGEVPVWIAREGAVCSELKGLRAAGYNPRDAELLPPGHVARWDGRQWQVESYYHVPDGNDDNRSLRQILDAAVEERAMSDVPVCTLLSGGLDSAAVAVLLKQHVPDLTAYVAKMGAKDSPDLKAARLVADRAGIRLVEVAVPEPTADDLRHTVHAIEMKHKAQVEIGWPCLVLACAIKSDGFKVTYSGEGADELWGSYGSNGRSVVMYHGVKKYGWHGFRRKLVWDQHRKNFPRANNAFMTAGIECRLPWLHRPIVERALAMEEHEVRLGGRAKGCVEQAMADLLPDKVLTRPKLAFQDGLGIKPLAAAHGGPLLYREEYERLFSSNQLELL